MKYLVVVFLFFFLQETKAQIYSTQNAHAEIKGDSKTGSYTGVSEQLEGTVDIRTGEVFFRLPLQSLSTGNHKRDKHMRETLNIEAHPYAEFKGHILSDFQPANPEPQNVKVKGMFSVHGQEKEIEVAAVLDPEDATIHFNSSFDIHITEFGMERPSVAFIKVDDKHTILVKGTLHKTEESIF